MTKVAAERARDCLAKGIYARLFRQMMLQINSRSLSLSSTSTYSIGVLDIAGFGIYTIFHLISIKTFVWLCKSGRIFVSFDPLVEADNQTSLNERITSDIQIRKSRFHSAFISDEIHLMTIFLCVSK